MKNWPIFYIRNMPRRFEKIVLRIVFLARYW